MKKFLSVLLMTTVFAFMAGAHCQIPCGIYDDAARITMMEEHVTTIEKSMKQIVKLNATATKDINQIVRWVNNKEEHATKIDQIVTYYFLAQRIKPETQNYEKKLKILHGILRATMKSKQTTNLEQIETLRKLIHEFEHLYFEPKENDSHTH